MYGSLASGKYHEKISNTSALSCCLMYCVLVLLIGSHSRYRDCLCFIATSKKNCTMPKSDIVLIDKACVNLQRQERLERAAHGKLVKLVKAHYSAETASGRIFHLHSC